MVAGSKAPGVVKGQEDIALDALYGLMQTYENKLGGGEGIEGLYGSITQMSMQKVIDAMKRNTGLDHRSVFIDIGAGLGRPLLHAMVAASVTGAWGVELDRVKCDKALAFGGHVVAGMVAKGLLPKECQAPDIICRPVEKVMTLEPATHAYSFWEGVPFSGKEAFGRLFAESRTLRAVAVVQRAIRGQEPAALMHELGFGRVLLVGSFPVKMSGSGRSFTAYVFSKISPAAAHFLDHVQAGQAAAHPAAHAGPRAAPRDEAQGAQAEEEAAVAGGTVALSSGGAVEAAGPRGGEAGPSGAASPSKGRRADDAEPGSSSPTKKPCTASPARSPADSPRRSRAAASGAGMAAALAHAAADDGAQGRGGRQGSGRAAQASKPPAQQARAVSEEVAEAGGAAGGKARGGQQVRLTGIAQFSRRTKQAAEGGKAAAGGGKAAGGKVPAAGTRSSGRLAAKAEALAAGAAEAAAVEV